MNGCWFVALLLDVSSPRFFLCGQGQGHGNALVEVEKDLGLARKIQPDGEKVKLVGFTAVRAGQEITVALKGKRSVKPSAVSLPAAQRVVESESVTGVLKLASAIDPRKSDEIVLVDSNDVPHRVFVPEGMIDDIVKPLWNDVVTVIGHKNKKRNAIILEHIEKAVSGYHPKSIDL